MSRRPRKRILIPLVDRANYGRMKPVMRAIREHEELQLLTVCSGTMILYRFGAPVRIVEADGFSIDGYVHMEIEGSVPATMAKSIGLGIMEFANEFQRLAPDIVLLIGDRYEALAAAIAAVYQNIPLAHIQGGEVSGSIDESARHAITKLSHLHFTSTERARDYVVRMGEDPDSVFWVGCPGGDVALNLDLKLPDDVFSSGVGIRLSPQSRYMLVVFHPVTTEFGRQREQAAELLAALDVLRRPACWLWPNIDAGADHISNVLRKHRERHGDTHIRFIKNFPPETYLKVLAGARCAVGNSSSFVRDASFFGTPVVLVGDRQDGREMGCHVLRVEPEASEILDGLRKQLAHGPYAPDTLYGDGMAAGRIADILARANPTIQKKLAYSREGVTV